MLTRRTKRVAVRPELAGDALRPLPLPLVLAVAGCLPADDKLRLALVSPAFRAVADDTSLWRDVTLGFGSAVGRVSDALLLADSAKARGTMRTLDLSGCVGCTTPAVTLNAAVAVCEANAATLEAVDVRCGYDPGGPGGWHLSHASITRLLAAVPRLRRLDADVRCELPELQALLLQHTDVLRVRCLRVLRLPDAAAVTALVAAVEAQPSVSQLGLCGAALHTAASLDAVVSLSLARRLGALSLDSCRLGAASMPALTRLLGREGGLGCLEIHDNEYVLVEIYNGDEVYDDIGLALPPSLAFCAALRASTLQRLVLTDARLFDDPDAGIALLSAATGHPSLQQLSVQGNPVADAHHAAVGTALGALVASNTPSLTSLNVCFCRLGDAGLAPLVAALAGNTALRSLDIRGNNVTRPLGVAMLAAVGANTGLRELKAIRQEEDRGEGWPEIAEAEALVAARRA